VLQETDWLTRGPHTQHHIFENLSTNNSIKITILDYDIDNIQHSKSRIVKEKVFNDIHITIPNSKVKIIRTAHLKIPFFRRISSLISNTLKIRKIIKKERPDLIVGFSMTNGMIGLILSKIFRIPYIFYYIDVLHKLVTIPYVQEIARVATRFSIKFADRVIIQSKFHQDYVINEGANIQKVRYLPDGITLKNIVVDKAKYNDLRKKFLITDEDFVIFFMGYLYDFAGLQEIIDFYNKDVLEKKLNLKFIILGDGGIYDGLVAHVKEIEAKWVFLEGRIPFRDITEYIELADLCLMSFQVNEITREIIPIKIFEYMAMKKPVLSNSLPSVLYEIGENNGVLFSKDQKALIKKIKELIPKKEELKEIGVKGFNTVKEKYTWSKIIKDFKREIIDVIKEKRKL